MLFLAMSPLVASESFMCRMCFPGRGAIANCDCKRAESGAWLRGDCIALLTPRKDPCRGSQPACVRAWANQPPVNHWTKVSNNSSWQKINCRQRSHRCKKKNVDCLVLSKAECAKFGFPSQQKLYYMAGCCVARKRSERQFCACSS